MKAYTKRFLLISFVCCCAVTTSDAADWNIYLAVIAGGRTVPGEINPDRGLIRISKDGKTPINMGYTNVPKQTPQSAKEYERLCEYFAREADIMGMSTLELDRSVWKSMYRGNTR